MALAVSALAACGSTATPSSTPAPRELRATEHQDAARLHAARAANLARIADALPAQSRRSWDDPKTGLWFRSLDEERQAAAHAQAAAQLEADHREHCAGVSDAEAAISPLQRFATGGTAKPDGVIVFLAPAAGPPDRLLQQLRCHQAWIKLGRAPEDACPLELTGIDLVAYGDGDGISVEIAVEDTALVAELQRRAQIVIETGTHPRAAP